MCKAGHDHKLLTADHRAPAWLALTHIGDTVIEAETVDGVTYPYERLEQRNCACGSTLGITLGINGERIA